MSGGDVTVIHGGWIVGFDGAKHRIIKDGVVVVRGDIIEHVGKTWRGKADNEIDARHDLVIPGLINMHCHVGAHAGDRMVFDGGRRDLFRSGFLNYCTAKGVNGPTIHDHETPEAGIRFSLASLLKCGATTVVDMGGELGGGAASDGMGPMVELAGELGIRLYTSPGYASAHHYFDQGGRHRMQWDEAAGLRGLERAVAFIRQYDGAFGGRFRGILVPLDLGPARIPHADRGPRSVRPAARRSPCCMISIFWGRTSCCAATSHQGGSQGLRRRHYHALRRIDYRGPGFDP